MREIKFRGKSLASGLWYELIINGDISNTIKIKSDYDEEEFIDMNTISQYTGLKDKNGKEIYEGDIVRVVKPGEYIPNRDDGGGIIDYDYRKPEERICIVEYFGATYATKEVKNEKYYAPLDWVIEDENIEVIGNIYEHKHLLEGTA